MRTAMATARTREQSASTGSAPARLFAPCRAACPVHVDVPGYLLAVAEGRFSDALDIVIERNPLPSVCGRICLRPCEDGCRRCLLDEPVAIAALKRAAADHGVYPTPRHPKRMRPERVAVVGSGPAGLTAAYDLACLGIHVTIYEEKPRLGGMLRYGIPNYRLPDAALDRDISFILGHGIESKTDIRIGRDITLAGLRASCDAVLVTAGLQLSRPVPIEGVDLPGVLTALPFLDAAARGMRVDVGKRVVVVGGGNVAVDVARTASRLGAREVTMICLESREEMPASDHELHDAETEGIRFLPSWGPRAVLGDDEVTGLRAVRCTSVFDAEKRFAPTFDESVSTILDADTVLFAVGQGVDVADLGVPLTQRGAPVHEPGTMRTPVERVYAAGDCVCGPTKVIDAIAEGHRAAAVIFRDLAGDDRPLVELDADAIAIGKVPEHVAHKLERKRRIQMERLEFYEACDSFDEVEFGYTQYEAAREAQRCLSCTTGARLTREKCAACLTCVRVCPHDVPSLQAGGYLYFDLDACHACGACVSQCPALALSLEGTSEAEMSRKMQRALEDHSVDATLAFRCGSAPGGFLHLGKDTTTLTQSCLLSVSERSVLEALQSGAAKVLFAECDAATCRFPHAQELVARSAERIRSILSQLGMEDAFEVVPVEPLEGEYLPWSS
ncbi:MAG: hypothetical protein C0418_00725 [Coriobacteriaceae bacterium]|nr:hypothetical protein [Coriobacteriaceae bacterium]